MAYTAKGRRHCCSIININFSVISSNLIKAISLAFFLSSFLLSDYIRHTIVISVSLSHVNNIDFLAYHRLPGITIYRPWEMFQKWTTISRTNRSMWSAMKRKILSRSFLSRTRRKCCSELASPSVPLIDRSVLSWIVGKGWPRPKHCSILGSTWV